MYCPSCENEQSVNVNYYDEGVHWCAACNTSFAKFQERKNMRCKFCGLEKRFWSSECKSEEGERITMPTFNYYTFAVEYVNPWQRNNVYRKDYRIGATDSILAWERVLADSPKSIDIFELKSITLTYQEIKPERF